MKWKNHEEGRKGSKARAKEEDVFPTKSATETKNLLSCEVGLVQETMEK
jgi:hypothetical protein